MNAWESFTKGVADLGGAGVSAWQTVTGKGTPTPTPEAPPAAKQSSLPSWLLPVGIGLGVLALLFVLLREK